MSDRNRAATLRRQEHERNFFRRVEENQFQAARPGDNWVRSGNSWVEPDQNNQIWGIATDEFGRVFGNAPAHSHQFQHLVGMGTMENPNEWNYEVFSPNSTQVRDYISNYQQARDARIADITQQSQQMLQRAEDVQQAQVNVQHAPAGVHGPHQQTTIPFAPGVQPLQGTPAEQGAALANARRESSGLVSTPSMAHNSRNGSSREGWGASQNPTFRDSVMSRFREVGMSDDDAYMELIRRNGNISPEELSVMLVSEAALLSAARSNNKEQNDMALLSFPSQGVFGGHIGGFTSQQQLDNWVEGRNAWNRDAIATGRNIDAETRLNAERQILENGLIRLIDLTFSQGHRLDIDSIGGERGDEIDRIIATAGLGNVSRSEALDRLREEYVSRTLTLNHMFETDDGSVAQFGGVQNVPRVITNFDIAPELKDVYFGGTTENYINNLFQTVFSGPLNALVTPSDSQVARQLNTRTENMEQMAQWHEDRGDHEMAAKIREGYENINPFGSEAGRGTPSANAAALISEIVGDTSLSPKEIDLMGADAQHKYMLDAVIGIADSSGDRTDGQKATTAVEILARAFQGAELDRYAGTTRLARTGLIDDVLKHYGIDESSGYYTLIKRGNPVIGDTDKIVHRPGPTLQRQIQQGDITVEQGRAFAGGQQMPQQRAVAAQDVQMANMLLGEDTTRPAMKVLRSNEEIPSYWEGVFNFSPTRGRSHEDFNVALDTVREFDDSQRADSLGESFITGTQHGATGAQITGIAGDVVMDTSNLLPIGYLAAGIRGAARTPSATRAVSGATRTSGKAAGAESRVASHLADLAKNNPVDQLSGARKVAGTSEPVTVKSIVDAATGVTPQPHMMSDVAVSGRIADNLQDAASASGRIDIESIRHLEQSRDAFTGLERGFMGNLKTLQGKRYSGTISDIASDIETAARSGDDLRPFMQDPLSGRVFDMAFDRAYNRLGGKAAQDVSTHLQATGLQARMSLSGSAADAGVGSRATRHPVRSYFKKQESNFSSVFGKTASNRQWNDTMQHLSGSRYVQFSENAQLRSLSETGLRAPYMSNGEFVEITARGVSPDNLDDFRSGVVGLRRSISQDLNSGRIGSSDFVDRNVGEIFTGTHVSSVDNRSISSITRDALSGGRVRMDDAADVIMRSTFANGTPVLTHSGAAKKVAQFDSPSFRKSVELSTGQPYTHENAVRFVMDESVAVTQDLIIANSIDRVEAIAAGQRGAAAGSNAPYQLFSVRDSGLPGMAGRQARKESVASAGNMGQYMPTHKSNTAARMSSRRSASQSTRGAEDTTKTSAQAQMSNAEDSLLYSAHGGSDAFHIAGRQRPEVHRDIAPNLSAGTPRRTMTDSEKQKQLWRGLSPEQRESLALEHGITRADELDPRLIIDNRGQLMYPKSNDMPSGRATIGYELDPRAAQIRNGTSSKMRDNDLNYYSALVDNTGGTRLPMDVENGVQMFRLPAAMRGKNGVPSNGWVSRADMSNHVARPLGKNDVVPTNTIVPTNDGFADMPSTLSRANRLEYNSVMGFERANMQLGSVGEGVLGYHAGNLQQNMVSNITTLSPRFHWRNWSGNYSSHAMAGSDPRKTVGGRQFTEAFTENPQELRNLLQFGGYGSPDNVSPLFRDIAYSGGVAPKGANRGAVSTIASQAGTERVTGRPAKPIRQMRTVESRARASHIDREMRRGVDPYNAARSADNIMYDYGGRSQSAFVNDARVVNPFATFQLEKLRRMAVNAPEAIPAYQRFSNITQNWRDEHDPLRQQANSGALMDAHMPIQLPDGRLENLMWSSPISVSRELPLTIRESVERGLADSDEGRGHWGAPLLEYAENQAFPTFSPILQTAYDFARATAEDEASRDNENRATEDLTQTKLRDLSLMLPPTVRVRGTDVPAGQALRFGDLAAQAAAKHEAVPDSIRGTLQSLGYDVGIPGETTLEGSLPFFQTLIGQNPNQRTLAHHASRAERSLDRRRSAAEILNNRQVMSPVDVGRMMINVGEDEMRDELMSMFASGSITSLDDVWSRTPLSQMLAQDAPFLNFNPLASTREGEERADRNIDNENRAISMLNEVHSSPAAQAAIQAHVRDVQADNALVRSAQASAGVPEHERSPELSDEDIVAGLLMNPNPNVLGSLGSSWRRSPEGKEFYTSGRPLPPAWEAQDLQFRSQNRTSSLISNLGTSNEGRLITDTTTGMSYFVPPNTRADTIVPEFTSTSSRLRQWNEDGGNRFREVQLRW